jgi:lipopolysaccharide export system permease protein
MDATTKRLSTAKFDDFSFDISSLVKVDTALTVHVQHLNTYELLSAPEQARAITGATDGAVAEEVHGRFARALFCVVTALIGFSTLLVGGYSRFGVWREVVLAFGLLILVDGLRGAMSAPVLRDASLWFLMYLPALIGLVVILAMLGTAARPGWWKRRRPA